MKECWNLRKGAKFKKGFQQLKKCPNSEKSIEKDAEHQKLIMVKETIWNNKNSKCWEIALKIKNWY